MEFLTCTVVKMSTRNNYENLWVCSAHWCINRCFRRTLALISGNAKEESETSQVYLRAEWNEFTAVINGLSFSLVVEEVGSTGSSVQRR